MKISKISLRGITTFRDLATLDLEALGPGIIAIAGPNGSGKTSLLEAIPGVLYRQTPSRGSVANMATTRDAMIEVAGENGSPFLARLDIDNRTGRQEAMLLDECGEPLAGPKVKEFDAEIAKKFAPLDVYLASFFASQTGVGSVLKMSRSDRRELFGRLLGLERLEEMAVAARERARETEADMATSRAALDTIRSGAEDVVILEDGLKAAQKREAEAAAGAKDAEEKARAAQVERDRISAAVEEAERAGKAAAEARRRADESLEKLRRVEMRETELRHKLDALADILRQAPAIRELAAKIRGLALDIENVRIEGEAGAAKREKFQGEANKKARALEMANFALKDAERAWDDATAKAGDANRRLSAAEKATAGVPCSGILEDEKRSRCPALVGHFKTSDESKKAIEEYGQRRDPLQRAFDTASSNQAVAEAEGKAANEEINRAGKDLADLRAKFATLRHQADELKAKDKSAELDKAEAEVGVLKPGLAAAAEATKAAEEECGKAREEASRLAAAAAAVDYGELAAADDSVSQAKREAEAVRLAAQDAHSDVVRLEVQVNAAREAEAKATAIKERLAPMDRDLAEWRWLGRGLGREGVQALELDAAGPRVSGLANELLADAYGPRFQIRFETQAAKADGKGVKETFDVVVVDTERGREGNGEDLSGGEKVIVGEALGLAVGLFHAQAAGVSLGTVIRDETVGALDPENGERYLAMLRAFLRVGHVHQLLYVAHNPALVDMADAVVRIEDGRIEVN